ncbi:MAG: class II glutamine amidotransferase [Pseudomonadota bacterium]
MSFGFAFLSNDAGLLSTALVPFQGALKVQGGKHGWGLGYYQNDQPLLKKQPKMASDDLDFCAKMQNLRTKVSIGHVRPTTAQNLTSENTEPFRYRNWLFFNCGSIPNFDSIRANLLESVPEFMRRNILGSTDSEYLFQLFLAFLNDTGNLNDPRMPCAVAGQALTVTLKFLDHLVTEQKDDRPKIGCVATNGNVLVAVRHGVPVSIARQNSYLNVGLDIEEKPINYPHLKTVALVLGTEPQSPSGWEGIAENIVVSVDSDLNIEYHAP